MKFSIVTLTSLVALVASQDPTTTTSLSPQASCAAKCDPDNTCCNAACYNVPCPDASMANDTTACAAACPQGSGTSEDTAAYASCQQSCYSSLFFPGTATFPPATGTGSVAGATATATGTGSNTRFTGTVDSHGGSAQKTGSSSNNEDTSDSSGTATATSSSASASETGAASHIGMQLGVAGALGAIMAAFFL